MIPGAGWRWLRAGELIAPGDQLWGNHSRRFVDACNLVGQPVQNPEHIRRRVEPRKQKVDVDALLKKHFGASHARAKADHYDDLNFYPVQ